jgi:hypothetical protein
MRAKRRDVNQSEIVEALRKAGYELEDLADNGKGIPDLLVESKSHIWVLLEIKAPGGKLTPAEHAFFERHQAPHYIARSPEEAIEWMEYIDGISYDN